MRARFASIVCACALARAVVACGGSSTPNGTPSVQEVPPNTPAPPPAACADDASVGCPCASPGAFETCRAEKVHAGSFVYCGGHRTCDPSSGSWGPCVPDINFGVGGITPADAGAD